MTPEDPKTQQPQQQAQQVAEMLESVDLERAIQDDEFRTFLDHIPFAIAIARLLTDKPHIVYINKEYENLTGQSFDDVKGKDWSVLDGLRLEDDPNLTFSQALSTSDDFIGSFKQEQPKLLLVEVYSGLIENEESGRGYHIVAMIDVTERARTQREELAQRLRDKDMLLKELQHRVKNNLQLITAFIRLDARNQRAGDRGSLDRLAGRIEALQFLYHDLAPEGLGHTVDLGHYVSQIAGAVMRTYAVEGLRLDLKVDVAPVSVNVAMPVGLLVNELMTNSFKHAFNGRESGTITVRCLHEAEDEYRVVVADDGIGLPQGATWPKPGKLGALILQSLRENARTTFSVESNPGQGVRATITVSHKTPAAKAN
jgi:PAS domain S-box-containing protein